MAKSKQNGSKAEKAAPAEKPVERFVLGLTDKVKRGFLLAFVEFVKAEGKVDTETLIGQFKGKQIDGKQITADRVRRYVSYFRVHGILKPITK